MPFDAQEQRRLAVIMFTDMVGYSALTQRDEALALRLLEAHRQIVRPILAQHGGREIKTIGDAFLVEFSSALAAATCAVEMQKALHDRNQAVAADEQVLLRIGLHAGDVVHRENDVYGDGVNIAARIEPLAEAGGVCISEDVARQIGNKFACPLVKLGVGELKNVQTPVVIYQIVMPWKKPRSELRSRLAFFLGKKSVRRFLWVGVLVAAVLGALLSRHRSAGPPGPANHLAVLPLVNISGAAHDDYFADGMTEELISSLSTIHELNVIARTSVTKFKGADIDVAEIGSALNVGSILEGSVRLAGDQARINVNLVDVRSQKTIWSQEYTRSIKDLFAVQSAIAGSVTEALKVKLLSGERTLLDRRGTDNSEAYRLYLLGRSQLNKRTGEEVMKAIGNFTGAVAAAPGFALAHAGLAEAYTLAGNAGYGNLPRDQAIDHAREHARRAIALDETLAEAHAALGYVKFRIDWDWAGAEAGFRRALELKPGYARAHEWYGLFLAILGRQDEALAEMRRAQQLDPLSASVSNGIGRILHFKRQYAEALGQFQRTLKLEQNYAEAYFGMAMSYQMQRRYDEGLAMLQKAMTLSPRPIMEAMMGLAQGMAGRKGEAQKIYDDMSTRQPPVSPYCLGITAIGLGDHDRAMQHFEKAYQERDGILIYLGVDPISETIWADPRFVALMEKMGLRAKG